MSGLDRWMPFYVADYFGDTNHLSTTEHGAYILLLMHYWRQGPLPNKDAVLANITRLERRHWRRVSEVIRNFFTLEDDGLLHQKRMDKELARTAHLSAVRRVAATSPRKGRKPPGGDGPAPAPRPAPPREGALGAGKRPCKRGAKHRQRRSWDGAFAYTRARRGTSTDTFLTP